MAELMFAQPSVADKKSLSQEQTLIVKKFASLQHYEPLWQQMQDYTDTRNQQSRDELWLLEHFPVFTQGRAGKRQHILCESNDIPVVHTDRGGQVTYHGPGQLVVYLLIDLRRFNMGVRDIVTCIEQVIISVLDSYNIKSHVRSGAPGVYVDQGKIASLGLRIRRGCTFHGLAFNIDMDLSPFSRINPCGYPGLQMVQLKDFYPQAEIEETSNRLVDYFQQKLMYSQIQQQERK